MKGDLGREAKIRTDQIETLNQCLEVQLLYNYFLKIEYILFINFFFFFIQMDIPKLNEAIKSEGSERDEMDQNIMRKTTEELLKLNNLIQVEKKNREESEQAIFDMLRDVVNRVKSEIDYERKNRFLFFKKNFL